MRFIRLSAVLGLMLIAAGCRETPPPASAVLAGDWETVTDEQVQVTVTFDANGVVVEIKGTLENGTTATLTVVDASTTVSGSDVTLNIPTATGTVVFDGTLSEDGDSLSGTLSRSIDIGNSIVVVPPATELTLTRVDDGSGDPCDGVTCDEGESCVDGDCVPDVTDPCDGVTCDAGESCVDGDCVPDVTEPCADADSAAGETYFSNNCSACHGADGASGFAPNIQCKTAEEIATALGTLAVHSSLTPTEENVCDLAAYLGSFDACTP